VLRGPAHAISGAPTLEQDCLSLNRHPNSNPLICRGIEAQKWCPLLLIPL
jgi:hypothetical protein